ncbi:hypothetical protein ACLKA6_018416, partial [Drosophila palustris]
EIALDTQDKSPVIIAGDFNAWATDWGSSRTTPRGSILLDTFASLNVCLLNSGSKSTYSKAGRESIIDLTFASPEIARITRWFVADLYTHSDHMAVISEFTATRSGRNHSQPGRLGYKSESLNIGRFLSAIQGLRVGTDANSTADSIAETITMACDASMAKVRKGGNPQRPVAWWNEDIAKARRECHAARRQCQRHRSSPAYESLAQIYRLRRKIFKDTVKLSKARLFRELCEAADAQPFGAAYKMVMGRLARQPMPNCPTQLGRIISSLFPTQPPLDSTLHQPQQTEHGTRVLTNTDEVLDLASKIKTTKAMERQSGTTTNRTVRDATISQWQAIWDSAPNGRWTHQLIKDLKPWLFRRHGQLNFYLAQLLTGHGCFKSYLHRFKHAADPFCEHCGQDVIEDAEHSFFECPLFERDRRLSAVGRQQLTPDNLIAHMLADEATWRSISNLAALVIKELRRMERLRNGAIN